MKNLNRVLDVCTSWVTERKASYLCIEDKIVMYNYLTKGDAGKWQFYTIPEVIRIIKYTLLTSEECKVLTNDVLIQVFQELGVVYEFGIESEKKLRQGIFNFNEEKPDSLAEVLISKIVKEIVNNYDGILLSDFITIYKELVTKLSLATISTVKRNKLLKKYLELQGFELRDKGYRVLVDGRKVTVILKKGKKPQDVVCLSVSMQKSIERNIN